MSLVKAVVEFEVEDGASIAEIASMITSQLIRENVNITLTNDNGDTIGSFDTEDFV